MGINSWLVLGLVFIAAFIVLGYLGDFLDNSKRRGVVFCTIMILGALIVFQKLYPNLVARIVG